MQIFNSVPNFEYLIKDNPELNLALWDMDGTLINTEITHAKSIVEVVNENSSDKTITLKEITEFCTGLTDFHVYEEYSKLGYIEGQTWQEFISLKDVYFYKILEKSDPNEIVSKEIISLLSSLQENQIKIGLVTSSEEKIAHELLEKFDLKKFFTFVITREDTEDNKPHPAPYIKALEMGQSQANQAIVFEDSIPGQTAANSAGIKCYGANWY